MIKEITTFIRDRVALLPVPVPVALVIDTNLFAGHRPQSALADACDVVLESSGGTPFPELPERADVVFQVLSRAKTYMTARARAWAIYNAIYANWALGSAGWRLPLILGESISTCDAQVDWTGTALSNDIIDKKEGTGSLKDNVVFPAIIAAWYPTQYAPAGTWDWTARNYILFWLRSDRASVDFTDARFYIYEGANYRYWDLKTLSFSTRGEWTAFKLLLSTGDGEAGPPDLALIDKIIVTFQATDTTAFYKKIDNIRVITEEYEIMVIEPLVTPQYIGQDEKSRYEFSTNYLMKIKRL